MIENRDDVLIRYTDLDASGNVPPDYNILGPNLWRTHGHTLTSRPSHHQIIYQLTVLPADLFSCFHPLLSSVLFNNGITLSTFHFTFCFKSRSFDSDCVLNFHLYLFCTCMPFGDHPVCNTCSLRHSSLKLSL